MQSFLSERWQRTKVNGFFTSWSGLLKGVHQGSVLGPLLFNLFINDFFFLVDDTDICNFADDNTLQTCDVTLKSLMEKLEGSAEKAIEWFRYNGMKLNAGKCKLLVSGNKHELMLCKVGESLIIESRCVKLLGVLIDSELSFKTHLNYICKKASNKINALSRQCAILPFYRRKILMQAFFNSQFGYCPLIWMCHSRGINARINNLHYRALRIIYRDDTLTFEELLERDGSVTVHHQNLRFLAIEMFKVVHGLAPSFMAELFVENRNRNSDNVSANTRSNSRFYNHVNPKTVNYGLESLRCLGPKIWNLVPSDIKNATSVPNFKTMIRKWKPIDCPCRLCLKYIKDVGFINI